MAKRKSRTRSPFLTLEFQNILAGGILVTLGFLMFLSTKESSVVGSFLAEIGKLVFGEYYRIISSPILIILGVMILIKKASWSASRAVGILLFYIATSSLIGWYTKKTT